jgi:tetratricopeptide (TPR) repeat protein
MIGERRHIRILREDHAGDPLGLIFVEPSEERRDFILERLREYLGPRINIRSVEVDSHVAELEVQSLGLPEESERIATAAANLRAGGARRNALGLFKEALQLRPLNAEAMLAMGSILRDLERYGEALDWLKRSREIGGETANVLVELARACLGLERRATALAYLRRAHEVDPVNFSAMRMLRTLGVEVDTKPPNGKRGEGGSQ